MVWGFKVRRTLGLGFRALSPCFSLLVGSRPGCTSRLEAGLLIMKVQGSGLLGFRV